MPEFPTGTVTFLFTDVEGSTRLLHELGDRYAEVLAEHRRALREAFERHGGVEVDTQGDAFFVAFAKASDALAAAAEGRAALESGPINVRMGLHTGEPLVTEEGYVGIDVHRAARIAAAGHGGQILVSQSTRDLTGADSLRDLGEHRLKDLSAPERIYQLGDESFPPLKSLNRTNLPVAATPLIGRATELRELLELVRGGALVTTVTGPGGAGKTRLALQVAAEVVDDFADGVFFVPLGALREPELVLPAIAQTIGARDVETLHDQEMLLMLDNLEHLLAAASDISNLLSRSPGVSLLVTSRAPLRIAGEREFSLLPLSDEEAVEFFLERAQAVRGEVTPDGAVAEICRRLDRLPLALELAAARVRMLEPTALLERLERRLPLLTSGARDAPERHRTLRAAIEWSDDLLREDERQLFARIAVFGGSFSLAAAEEVCNADVEVLAALVENSLLKPIGKSRFLMLETIREYALERLEESHEAGELRRRHAEHFLALAEQAEPHFTGANQLTWLPRLAAENDNLRAALAWSFEAGDLEIGLRLTGALWAFWMNRGALVEGRRWVEEALARSGSHPTPLRLKLLAGASNFAIWQLDAERAKPHAEERLRLARKLGNGEHIAGALNTLGHIAWDEQDHEGAQVRYEESIRVARESGDELKASSGIIGLGNLAADQGELERAETFYREGLAIMREAGDTHGIALVLGNIGNVVLQQDRPHEALALFREALQWTRELHDIWLIGGLLEGAAATMSSVGGDPGRAARLLAASEGLLQSVGAYEPDGWYPGHNLAATMEALRTELGSEPLDGAWAEGREMKAEQAVEYAIESIDSL